MIPWMIAIWLISAVVVYWEVKNAPLIEDDEPHWIAPSSTEQQEKKVRESA